jgi:hypothetical protein
MPISNSAASKAAALLGSAGTINNHRPRPEIQDIAGSAAG